MQNHAVIHNSSNISLVLSVNEHPLLKRYDVAHLLQLSYYDELECNVRDPVTVLQEHVANVSSKRYRDFVSTECYTNNEIGKIHELLHICWQTDKYEHLVSRGQFRMRLFGGDDTFLIDSDRYRFGKSLNDVKIKDILQYCHYNTKSKKYTAYIALLPLSQDLMLLHCLLKQVPWYTMPYNCDQSDCMSTTQSITNTESNIINADYSKNLGIEADSIEWNDFDVTFIEYFKLNSIIDGNKMGNIVKIIKNGSYDVENISQLMQDEYTNLVCGMLMSVSSFIFLTITNFFNLMKKYTEKTNKTLMNNYAVRAIVIHFSHIYYTYYQHESEGSDMLSIQFGQIIDSRIRWSCVSRSINISSAGCDFDMADIVNCILNFHSSNEKRYQNLMKPMSRVAGNYNRVRQEFEYQIHDDIFALTVAILDIANSVQYPINPMSKKMIDTVGFIGQLFAVLVLFCNDISQNGVRKMSIILTNIVNNYIGYYVRYFKQLQHEIDANNHDESKCNVEDASMSRRCRDFELCIQHFCASYMIFKLKTLLLPDNDCINYDDSYRHN